MAIADDRKIISDADIIAVVSNVRTRRTRHRRHAHALHESGYGHGV